MSSSPSNSAAASGSEGGYGIDEKKRRRMESNRESARRSRQRKQQHLDDLIKQVGNLKRENEDFEKKIADFSGGFSGLDAQNRILLSEMNRLAARLESLESVIEIAKVVRGSSNGGNGGSNEYMNDLSSDPMMMKPWQWQVNCSSLAPIMASSGLRSFDYDA